MCDIQHSGSSSSSLINAASPNVEDGNDFDVLKFWGLSPEASRLVLSLVPLVPRHYHQRNIAVIMGSRFNRYAFKGKLYQFKSKTINQSSLIL